MTNASAALQQLAARGAVWRGWSGHGLPAVPTGVAALDARLPGGGWPAAALSELLIPAHGIGEMSLCMPTLARLASARRRVALIAPPHLPYAPGWAQAGVDLEQVIVAEPPPNARARANALWCAEQLLRVPEVGAVLLWCANARNAELRRLQLAAEAGGGLGLLFRPAAEAVHPSPAALRLKLAPGERGPWVEILKARGGRSHSAFALEPAA